MPFFKMTGFWCLTSLALAGGGGSAMTKQFPKRGLAGNPPPQLKENPGTVTWYWTWAAKANPNTTQEFVPNKFSRWWPSNADVLQNHSSPYILTWNEPNHKEQTNISPTNKGVQEDWKKLYAAAKKAGKLIGSPQVAGCGGNCNPKTGNGFDEWLVPFLEGVCPKCTSPSFSQSCCDVFPDFITTHIYYGSIDQGKSTLEAVKKRFPKVPLWITEYGFSGDPKNEAEGIKNVMDFAAILDREDQVERYSWFQFAYQKTANSRQFNQLSNNGDLTAVGKAYLGL